VPGNGEINKTVQVQFNALPGKNPADADNFQCGLDLINIQGIKTSPAISLNSICNNSDNDFQCAKQGKPVVLFLTGPIP